MSQFGKDLNEDEVWDSVFQTYLDEKGLIGFAKESINDFYKVGISQIVTEIFKDNISVNIPNERCKTAEDKKIASIYSSINFSNISLKNPTTTGFSSSYDRPLFPTQALLGDKSYNASIILDVHIIAKATLHDGQVLIREKEIKSHRLAGIFAAVGSDICNTIGKTKKGLLHIRHDPLDIGGYVIIKGKEWSIDIKESTCFNQCRIFVNNWGVEIMRNEMISKPGDSYENSKQIIIRLLNNGNLTIELVTPTLKKIQIPFYLIYRLLGWENDEKIIQHIINMDINNLDNQPLRKPMFDIIKKCFNLPYDTKNSVFSSMNNIVTDIRELVVKRLYGKLKKKFFKDLNLDNTLELQQAVTIFMDKLDTELLPHIGLTSASRNKKLIYLSYMINKMLLVYLDIIPQTDRDSWLTKRFLPPGVVISKAFKTHFNSSFVASIKKQMTKDFKNMPFNSVNLSQLFFSAASGSDFTRLMSQAITTGNKTKLKINPRQSTTNRTSTQLLTLKNRLSSFSTMGMLVSPNNDNSNNSSRSHKMRMPHPSSMGYGCIIQSPESGDKVGLHKQSAITTTITTYGSSEFLKNYLKEDSLLTLIEDANPLNILPKVFCNGDLIGVVEEAADIVNKYVNYKRNNKINRKTSIHWCPYTNNIHFWVDYGRISRPCLIVYNNINDWKELKLKAAPKDEIKDFRQGIILTKDIINKVKKGDLSFDDLVTMKIIEFITPDESSRLLFAVDIDTLKKNENNILVQYTHVDIPRNMLGIAALTSPFANYNATPRNTYQTAQVRQGGSKYALNYPYRIDKDTFNQNKLSLPLVTTCIGKQLSIPIGHMAIVAVMCYQGYNQEDSLMMSQKMVQNGIFSGSWFTYYKSCLEKNDKFTVPDTNQTLSIKHYANYSKLSNKGLIPVGTVVVKNDIIIGKVSVLPKTASVENNAKFIDKSVLYKLTTPAIVHKVHLDKDDDGTIIVKVALRSLKPVIVGNKFSSRHAQKGVCGLILNQEDAPFTSNGMIPNIIQNPHSYPSRMTCGQPDEQCIGKICAKRGVTCDGTIFRKINKHAVKEELKKLGLEEYGRERLFCGLTGAWIDTKIYMGPTYYQLLQKLVEKAIYVVNKGPTDIMTRQPLDGKAVDGGLRLSELQRDSLLSHGASKLFASKFFKHSDDFEIYICRCGTRAIVNPYLDDYMCPNCKENSDINVINSSWTSKQLMMELHAMHIGTKYNLEPYVFY